MPNMSTSLTDGFGRRIEYVRLSVTDRCDFRCQYCMPEHFKDFETPDHWLTFDEIERVIGAFSQLGTKRIRITGGEPLTRKGLPELAGRLSALPGVEDLSLSTNASQMTKHADDLHKAGISRINVSLDSLNEATFTEITRNGKLHKVIDGLMAAKKAGFGPIKINMVVMRGVNDHEVESMVEFCMQHGFTLRFIETMPMGQAGQSAVDQYVDLQMVRQRLAQRFELISSTMPGGGPARYVQVAGTTTKIGFITPISQHFCETCNRVRLSVDGTLYLCLGQDDKVELRPLLRAGITDTELREVILSAMQLKPERHEFKDKPSQVVRLMSMTGG